MDSGEVCEGERPVTGGGKCRVTWILLGFLVLALGLRLVNYDQSLWFDEACMSRQRLDTLPQLLATVYVDIHPPLYICFMFVWNSALGDAEWSLRLFPLLSGLGGLVMIYVAGRRLVGERAALVAAGLLCLSPVHLWYSIEARPYTAILLGVLCLVWLFDRLLEGDTSRRTRWSYGLLLVALLWLHYYLAVYVLLLAGLAVVDRRAGAQPGLRRRLLWLHGLGLVSIMAWVAVKVFLAEFDASMGYMRSFDLPELYSFLFQWCWTGDTLPAGLEAGEWPARKVAWLLIQGLGVLLFALGMLRLARSRRERPRSGYIVLYLAAIPLFLLALPLIGMGGNFVERSALPALPFLFLIIALGWTSISIRWLRTGLGALLLLACVGNLAAYYAHGDVWTIYKPHPDWRSLAVYLGEEIEHGGAGRPVYSAMPNPRCLPYYDARIQQEANISPTDTGPEAIAEKLEGRFGETIGGWLARPAIAIFEDFERNKAARRAATELWIHDSGDGSIQALQLDSRRGDGILYVVKNHFHPPGDTSVDALAVHPRLERLEERSFRGLSVYKLRELDR